MLSSETFQNVIPNYGCPILHRKETFWGSLSSDPGCISFLSPPRLHLPLGWSVSPLTPVCPQPWCPLHPQLPPRRDRMWKAASHLVEPLVSCKESASQGKEMQVTRVKSLGWKQLAPVFLPGKFHGRRSLVGYSPWSQRIRHDWAHVQLQTTHGVDHGAEHHLQCFGRRRRANPSGFFSGTSWDTLTHIMYVLFFF